MVYIEGCGVRRIVYEVLADDDDRCDRCDGVARLDVVDGVDEGRRFARVEVGGRRAELVAAGVECRGVGRSCDAVLDAVVGEILDRVIRLYGVGVVYVEHIVGNVGIVVFVERRRTAPEAAVVRLVVPAVCHARILESIDDVFVCSYAFGLRQSEFLGLVRRLAHCVGTPVFGHELQLHGGAVGRFELLVILDRIGGDRQPDLGGVALHMDRQDLVVVDGALSLVHRVVQLVVRDGGGHHLLRLAGERIVSVVDRVGHGEAVLRRVERCVDVFLLDLFER